VRAATVNALEKDVLSGSRVAGCRCRAGRLVMGGTVAGSHRCTKDPTSCPSAGAAGPRILNAERRVGFSGAIALIVLLASCVTTPDGRRALTPGARAFGQSQLEHVLRCGLPAVAAALIGGGQPDYRAASQCHLQLVGEQLGRAIEAAPAADEAHGREVVRATELQTKGDTRAAKKVARSCANDARKRWIGDATP
jgi:hypothetical protein